MPTKKRKSNRPKDELRPEYDLVSLHGGVRGKYYARAIAGTNLVLIEPEIAEMFPDARAVNDALRALAKEAKAQAGKRSRRKLPAGVVKRGRKSGPARRSKAGGG